MATDRLQRWREADRLFTHWLELEPDARVDWLASVQADPAVRAALDALLAQHVAGEEVPSVLRRALPGVRSNEVRDRLAGRELGAWHLIEEIGRGGMSVVYRAERRGADFRQTAAVKVLGMAAWGTDGAARFERERLLLARLRHPLIAPLIDGGFADDGTPYLVMSLIEGESLDVHCERARLDWRARVALLTRICDAVAHAHRNLVVHRDLKPGNVIVTADSVPILLDFGIAKLLGDDSNATRTVHRAMTPAYAAPEQLSGDPVTTATDVHALGVMLRELCGSAAVHVRDLANVIAMATRAEPERRYPDARALGEDLARLLAHRPVHATPDSLGYRLRSALGRHRTLALASLAVVLALVAGVATTVWQAQRATREARVAREQAARATAVQGFLSELFAAGDSESTGGEDPRVSELVELAAPRVREEFAAMPAVRSELLRLLGQIDTTTGKHERAAAWLDDAERAALEAGDARLLALARIRQGMLANVAGDAPRAIERFESALALRSGDPVADAVLITDALPGWAHAVGNTGRESEAEARLEATLADSAYRFSAPQRADLLVAQAGLQTGFERKLSLLREAQRLIENSEGGHRRQLSLEAELAVALAGVGHLEEAIEHARSATQLAERLNPGPSLRRARAYNNLANMLHRAGRSGEAARALATAEGIFEASGDVQSPAFAALVHNRAALLRDVGDSAAATLPARTAYALARTHFGVDDRRTRIAARSLAFTLAEAMQAEEGEQILRSLEASLPEDASDVERFDVALAGSHIALALRRHELAERRLDAARSRLASGMALNPARRLRLARAQAALLASEERFAEGATQLAEALEADAQGDGAWVESWRAHRDRAGLLHRAGDAAGAGEALGEARRILREHGGDGTRLSLP